MHYACLGRESVRGFGARRFHWRAGSCVKARLGEVAVLLGLLDGALQVLGHKILAGQLHVVGKVIHALRV